MALNADDVTEMDRILSQWDGGTLQLALLRQHFPHLSWSRCDAGDVDETPFRTYPRFEIHLLDGAEHCVRITDDPARATGIVVAERRAAP